MPLSLPCLARLCLALGIQVPLWLLHLLHIICPSWEFSGLDELLTCLSRTAHPMDSHAQGVGWHLWDG